MNRNRHGDGNRENWVKGGRINVELDFWRKGEVFFFESVDSLAHPPLGGASRASIRVRDELRNCADNFAHYENVRM